MQGQASDGGGRDGLGELIGLEYLETGPDEVRARIEVADRHPPAGGPRARGRLRGDGGEHLLGGHLAGRPR